MSRFLGDGSFGENLADKRKTLVLLTRDQYEGKMSAKFSQVPKPIMRGGEGEENMKKYEGNMEE